MSTLIGMEIRAFPATRVIGKQVTCPLGQDTVNPGPALWDGMMRDGSLELLLNLPQRATLEPDTVGWMGDYDPASNAFTYIAGILAQPGTPAPSGCVYRDIPACQMAVASIRGVASNHDVYEGAHNHTAQAMQERGYEYDPASGGFEMEYHSHTRFTLPEARGDEFVVLDYYTPCRRREG
jgi:predicted transcriptional regulator YdeE